MRSEARTESPDIKAFQSEDEESAETELTGDEPQRQTGA